MQIYGFNKLTLLDYPGHLAATLFLGGCNMRCPFCHNASLVTDAVSLPVIPEAEVLNTLSKRLGVLEGVCITGGEPTLYKELPELIRKIKKLGFHVKLDTNGTNPDLLKELIQEGLIDYVAMDIKNSPVKYSLTTGIPNIPMDKIKESVDFLLTTPVAYEFRTTLVKELHTKEDLEAIGTWIQGARAYYLQSYEDSGDIICPGFENHSKETLIYFKEMMMPYVQQVSLRGID